MSSGEVEVLFECLVCGKGYNKVQSLRAHMKVHKGHGFERTAIWVDRGLWFWFKEYARRHHTTTCHLLGAIIKVAQKGEDVGLVDLGASNPVIIQVHEHFYGRPRSGLKVEIPAVGSIGPTCRRCQSLDVEEWMPEFTNLLQGRCRKCGAEWLVGPGLR